MKVLAPFAFVPADYRRELADLAGWLRDQTELGEQTEILPFFRQRPQLASRLGLLNPLVAVPDCQAFEFDVFGDFVADLVVGDATTGAYTFVEFEDARRHSVFSAPAGRYRPAFGPRLEQGYSQIVDWFYKLDGLQGSRDMQERFGHREIHYEGILVIGRDEFISLADQNRLKWRRERVVVNSKHIHLYTFDQLYELLRRKEESSRGIVLNE